MAKKRTFRQNDTVLEDTQSLGEELRELFDRDQAEFLKIPLELLLPNRANPRQAETVGGSLGAESIEELAASISEHGFLGALDGRRLPDGRVELAYGTRRLLAAQRAGTADIPVYVHEEWDDGDMLAIALVENVQRVDLTPAEEAAAYKAMNDQLGWSQREIAKRTGKPLSYVQDMMALSSAPDDVKEMVELRPDTVRHARYISRIQDREARRILRGAVLNREITSTHLPSIVRDTTTPEEVQAAVAEIIAVRSEPPGPPIAETPTKPIESEPAGPTSPLAGRKQSQLRHLDRARHALVTFKAEKLEEHEHDLAQDSLRQIIEQAHKEMDHIPEESETTEENDAMT